MITERKFDQESHLWIDVQSEDRDKLRFLYKSYGIDSEVIDYSLDKHERARLEYDGLTNTLIIIFNVPNQEKINNHYETIPMTFIVKDTILMTITNTKNAYVSKAMENYLKKFPDLSLYKFLFNTLFSCIDFFFPYIEEMDDDRVQVDHKLKSKTSKQNLLLLSDLEIGIVYFVSAAKQNMVLLEQIRAHSVYKTMNDAEKEQLDDVLIEAKQLVEMTQLSAQILQQLSGAYNNILNNSLNETMQVLTVFSVLLTIPTIISGFFGMNMPLPLENNPMGWIITVVVTALLWILLSKILQKWMR